MSWMALVLLLHQAMRETKTAAQRAIEKRDQGIAIFAAAVEVVAVVAGRRAAARVNHWALFGCTWPGCAGTHEQGDA